MGASCFPFPIWRRTLRSVSNATALGSPRGCTGMGPFARSDICREFRYSEQMRRKLIIILTLLLTLALQAAEDRLPNTMRLEIPGDLASNLVAGVDRFLLNQLFASEEQRARHWRRDFSSTDAYNKSIATNRARLAHIIGARDRGLKFSPPRAGAFGEMLKVATTPKVTVYSLRANAFGDVTVEGLLLIPTTPVAAVVAIPDADVTPEQLAGLEPGVAAESQYARI